MSCTTFSFIGVISAFVLFTAAFKRDISVSAFEAGMVFLLIVSGVFDITCASPMTIPGDAAMPLYILFFLPESVRYDFNKPRNSFFRIRAVSLNLYFRAEPGAQGQKPHYTFPVSFYIFISDLDVGLEFFRLFND